MSQVIGLFLHREADNAPRDTPDLHSPSLKLAPGCHPIVFSITPESHHMQNVLSRVPQAQSMLKG